ERRIPGRRRDGLLPQPPSRADGDVAAAPVRSALARTASRGGVLPHRRELRDGHRLLPSRRAQPRLLRDLRGLALHPLGCVAHRRHRYRQRDRRAAPLRHRLRDHRDVRRHRRACDPPRDRRRCRACRGRDCRRARPRGRGDGRRDPCRRRRAAARGRAAAMIWAAIIRAGLVTYLVRALPFAVTLPVRLPPPASRYLEALPVAIIAALVGPAVLAPGGTLTHGPEPLAALLVIGLVAWRRSLLIGVIGGVAAVAFLRAIS